MFSALSKILPKRTAYRMGMIYALVAFLLMIAIFLITLQRVQRYFLVNVDMQLLEEAREMQILIQDPHTMPEFIRMHIHGYMASMQNNILGVVVQNAEKTIIYEPADLISPELLESLSYPDFEEVDLEDIQERRFEGHRHPGRVLGFTSGPEGPPLRWAMAVYPSFIYKSLSNIKYILLWILLVSLVLFALIGVILARKSYLPVRRMILEARGIEAEYLERRLDRPGKGQELDELADSFNSLFGRLHEAFQRERDFSVHVAHELRTPLTALRGCIEAVLLDESLPSGNREELAEAISATDRLNRLIERLLFLGRAENLRKPDLKKESVHLKSLVENMRDLVLPDEENGWARLKMEIPGELECFAEKEMLQSLILNLLENAKKHTAPGTPIFVRASKVNGHIRLAVIDKGTGIPLEDRNKIFERFTSKRQPGAIYPGSAGTGLGLCIARAIARLHGGDLTYSEARGGGSVFTCEIPQNS